MKFRRAYLLLFMAVLMAVTLALTGCTFAETRPDKTNARTLTLMTWNVHNLFDGADNGFEYDEFTQSAGWSTEKYLGRINSISAAIGKIEPLPDILIFQEIENLKNLEDIAKSMSGRYTWSHFANNPGAALGLGILSRFPFLETRIHSITIGGETTPRPVLETRIKAEGEEFVIFSCHWKSKVGGDDATENVRKASARVILRRLRELWEKEPNLGVIIAGDLNENHDDFFKRNALIICALLPDDPYCAQLTGCKGADGKEDAGRQKDFIILSRNKPPAPVHFPQDCIVFFSPWMQELENGTYFYRHNWETIDHFLLSRQFFSNTGWVYEKSAVVDCPPFTSADGTPIRYNPRTGTGLSDHLPLLLTLKTADNDN